MDEARHTVLEALKKVREIEKVLYVLGDELRDMAIKLHAYCTFDNCREKEPPKCPSPDSD